MRTHPASAPPPQFELQYDSAVDMMTTLVQRALQDRVAAVEVADTVVTYPPGGKAVFGFYPHFATDIMRIGQGETASIAPIVFADDRAARLDLSARLFRH